MQCLQKKKFINIPQLSYKCLSSLVSRGVSVIVIRIRTCTSDPQNYWEHLLHSAAEIFLQKSLSVTSKVRATRKLELSLWDLSLFGSLKDLLMEHGTAAKGKISSWISQSNFNNEFSMLSKSTEKLMKSLLAKKPLSQWGNFQEYLKCNRTTDPGASQHIFCVYFSPVLWENLSHKATRI